MNLANLHVPDPEQGWMYLDAIVLIKCMDSDGNIRYRELKSPSLTSVEALGMVATYEDTLRSMIMKSASQD
jgi:hypothetical protein